MKYLLILKIALAGLVVFPLFSQDSSIHMAVVENNRDQLRVLLDNGADINAKMQGGWTPLMISIKYGYLDLTRDLINAKADINVGDDKGNTALILAVSAKRIEGVRILLANRADVTLKNDDGMDALEIARLLGAGEILDLLNNYLSQKG